MSEAQNPMLSLKGVRKVFFPGTVNEKIALAGVDLDLAPGDFVTIIGGNGAGKSTMLNATAGVWPIDEGTIYVDGINITKLSEYKRAKYIGRVFQDPVTGTAGNMQIEENLALAARRGERRTLRWAISSKERNQFRELVATLGLGLENRMTTKVGLLSGEISDSLIEKNKLTALMVTHNMKDAITHGNRLIMMHEGRIIFDVAGEEKKKLTVEMLMEKFSQTSGTDFANDRALLG